MGPPTPLRYGPRAQAAARPVNRPAPAGADDHTTVLPPVVDNRTTAGLRRPVNGFPLDEPADAQRTTAGLRRPDPLTSTGGYRAVSDDRPGARSGNHPAVTDQPGVRTGSYPIVPDAPGTRSGNYPAATDDRPGARSGSYPIVRDDARGTHSGDYPAVRDDRPGTRSGDYPAVPDDTRGTHSGSYPAVSDDAPGTHSGDYPAVRDDRPGTRSGSYPAVRADGLTGSQRAAEDGRATGSGRFRAVESPATSTGERRATSTGGFRIKEGRATATGSHAPVGKPTSTGGFRVSESRAGSTGSHRPVGRSTTTGTHRPVDEVTSTGSHRAAAGEDRSTGTGGHRTATDDRSTATGDHRTPTDDRSTATGDHRTPTDDRSTGTGGHRTATEGRSTATGTHRAMGKIAGRRRIAKWPIVAGAFVVLLVLGLLGWGWADNTLNSRAEAQANACTDGNSTMTVVVTPTAQKPVSAAADRWNRANTVVHAHCVHVDVRAIPSQQVLDALTGKADPSTIGGLPAAWIPENSYWVDQLQTTKPGMVGAPAESVASARSADYPFLGLAGTTIDEVQARAAQVFRDYLREPAQQADFTSAGLTAG